MASEHTADLQPQAEASSPAWESKEKKETKRMKNFAEKPLQWINALIVWIIGLMVFFVPFIYADWTVEYIRYNKTTFIIGGTLLVLILWAIKVLLQGELKLKRTVLDLPILLFVFAATAAVFLSQIPSQSIWGNFSNFEDSYILMISAVVAYYALVNHVRGSSDWLLILGMVLSSGAILGAITVLQYHEIYLLPFSGISNTKFFSPFGTIHQVAFFLSVLLPVASGLFIGSVRHKRWFLTVLTAVVLILSSAILGMVDYWPTWLIGALGVIASLGVCLPALKGSQRNLAFIPLAIFVVALLAYKIPAARSSLVPTDVSKPVIMSLSSSFDIAKESVKKFALSGAGQGNYGYAFKVLRPAAFNQKTDWLLNYNRPYNNYFLLLTTMGLLGLAALVYFTVRVFAAAGKAIFTFVGQEDADPAVLGLFVGLIAYFLVLLLSWETIPLQLMFWVILALAVYVGFEPDVSGITGEKTYALKLAAGEGAKQKDFLSIGVSIGVILLSLFIGYKVASVYAVDVNLRDAINSGNDGDTNASLVSQNKVVTSSEVQDYDLRGVAILLHNQGIAAEVSTESEEQQAQDIERKRAFFREAVRFAQRATDANPKSSENWEVLLGIYSTLSDYGINKIDNVPLDTLMSEIRTNLSTLTPSEVTWRLRLANYYIKAADYDTALTLLGQANILKSNLVDVHYLAAKAFGGNEDYENAIVEANTALRSLAADHAWTSELNDLVKEWKDAQAKAAKDTTKSSGTTTTTDTTTDTTTETTTDTTAQ